MRALILSIIFVLCAGSVTERKVIILGVEGPNEDGLLCSDYTDIIEEYRASMYNFAIKCYKEGVLLGNSQFVLSAQSIWITLAAIAEGADAITKRKVFNLLKLPKDMCIRQRYYKAATTRFTTNENVGLVRKSAFIVDDKLEVDEGWREFIMKNSLIKVAKAPIKYNTFAVADLLRKITSSQAKRLNLSGNSVLMDTVDFNGLWTTAFNNADIQKSPFYNQSGHQIGYVDLMRTKLQAKVGYSEHLKVKLLGLSIGDRGQYAMYFAQIIGNEDINSVVNKLNLETAYDAILALRDAVEPIDIAIPRVFINSEVDVRTILERMGFASLWSDPEVTRYISDPPALPSSYIQRASLTINHKGVNPSPAPQQWTGPQEHPFYKEFIADGPFIFAIVDIETFSAVVSGLYTQPTYPIDY